jgi:hypothetical protein
MKTILIILLFASANLTAQLRYVIPTHTDVLPLVSAYAYTQLGVSKQDSMVLQYLESVELYSYANWCQAGIYWSFKNAFGYYNDLFGTVYKVPIIMSGVANATYNDAKTRGINVHYTSEVYDLIVWRVVNSWQGHIELVVSRGEKGWVTTIGFNTSNNDTRQGGFVEIKRRHLHNPIGKLQVRGLVGFYSTK